MQIRLRDDLPFVTVTIEFDGVRIEIDEVLVDTGAARTILAADAVAFVGISPSPTDVLRKMRGVGGSENVYTRCIRRLSVGDQGIDDFSIQVGGMDYGFTINGILGMDFLRRTCAVVDLGRMLLEFHAPA